MWKAKTKIWGGAESLAFYRAVCDRLTRATYREKEQIRRELADHLQDRTEALMERGVERRAAEERAVTGMGNPIQIAYDLNKTFSRFWLVCKRVLIVLFCLVLVQCFGRDVLGDVADNIWTRLPSQVDLTQMPGGALAYEDLTIDLGEIQKLNVKMNSDSTVVRLDQIAVGNFEDDYSGKRGFCVAFSAEIYSKNPSIPCNANLRLYPAEDPDGLRMLCTLSSKAVGGHGDGKCFLYEVECGTEVLELAWERYGRDLTVCIPLNWEGVA